MEKWTFKDLVIGAMFFTTSEVEDLGKSLRDMNVKLTEQTARNIYTGCADKFFPGENVYILKNS